MIFYKMFSRKWLPITILVLIAAIVCGRLGVWQLDRLAERRVFNAHVHAMQAMQPLLLPVQIDLTNMEYRAVKVSGTYDFANQVAIRNQFYNNVFGYHLLTPFRLIDDTAILVDRGWIPSDGNSLPADWQKYDRSGVITLNGVIRLSQTAVSFGGVDDPTLTPVQTRLDFWVYVNLGRIQEQMPYSILPVYIQLDPEPNRTTPPIPYQPELDLSEGPHQSYAIQWFSFGTLFLVGYPIYMNRQESRKS
jgi:surfeit locus 1 family protein